MQLQPTTLEVSIPAALTFAESLKCLQCYPRNQHRLYNQGEKGCVPRTVCIVSSSAHREEILLLITGSRAMCERGHSINVTS